ncbi:MAG TPA: GGDEF domain-containing protein [Rectinemataceae bacterium]|nr:GGDEF domain-containing protein [Rectinemataceae bacterium]
MSKAAKLGSSLKRGRAIAALVAVGFVLFGVLGAELGESYRSSLEKVRLQSSNMSLLLAERIVGTLDETDYVLRDVAGRMLPRAESAPVPPSPTELARMLAQKASTLEQVSSLVLYDARGDTLASSDRRADGGASGRRFFEALSASANLDSYASRVYRAPSGRHVVTLARAIRDSHSRLIAVAAADIDTDCFQDELSKLDVGSRGFVTILDAGLRIVASLPARAESVGSMPADASLTALLENFAAHNGPGAVDYVASGDFLYSIRACQDFPFFVVVAGARSEALALWTIRLTGYGFTVALVSILLVLLARSVTTDLRRNEQLAHYDVLTGLPNRVLYFDRMAGTVARAKREGRRFALLYVDLDGFKPINDHFGHASGDFVLREAARRMRSVLRDSDTAARMGGDEFTVLLEQVSRTEDAALVAEKIGAAIAEPIALPDGRTCSVRASVGLAIFPDDAGDGEALLRFADASMYERKRRKAGLNGAGA